MEDGLGTIKCNICFRENPWNWTNETNDEYIITSRMVRDSRDNP